MSRQRYHFFVAVPVSRSVAAHARSQLSATAPFALAGIALILTGCTSLPWSHDTANISGDSTMPLEVPAPTKEPQPVVRKSAGSSVPPAPSAEDLGRAPAVTLPSTFLPPVNAQEYQVWRCTPAQDLLMAFSQEKAAQEGAKVSHDWLRLWSRQHAYTLGRVVSASGARYQVNASSMQDNDAGESGTEQASSGKERAAPGEEELEVWFKGAEAMLHNARGNLECVQDDRRVIHPAPDRPLLVAQGNEPGWQVSLDSKHNLLTLTAMQGLLEPAREVEASVLPANTGATSQASGVQVLKMPYQVDGEASDSRVLKAQLPAADKQGEPLQLVVAPGACFDSMQGAPYPLTATLIVAGRKLQGCGEAFR